MRAELIGPDDDPEIRVTMSLREAYQVQAGGAPHARTADFDEFERQVFALLKEARRRGVEAMTA